MSIPAWSWHYKSIILWTDIKRKKRYERIVDLSINDSFRKQMLH